MRKLNNLARNEFRKTFQDKDKYSVEDVISFLRPYFFIDEQKIYEQELRKEALSLIASTFRDEENIRQVFLFEEDGKSMFFNMDTVQRTDIAALEDTILNIQKRIAGLQKSLKKAIGRRDFLASQVSIAEWEKEQLKREAN
jgi:hypothetical protein